MTKTEGSSCVCVCARSLWLKFKQRSRTHITPPSSASPAKMPPMKAAKKPMTKTEIAKAIAEEHELKASTAGKIMNSLAEIVSKEVKSTGKFTIPGVVMIKTRFKPATKATQREIFGEMRTVKARPARTVVKAFPVAALKKSV